MFEAGTFVIATREFTAYIFDSPKQFLIHDGVAGRVVGGIGSEFDADGVSRVLVKWYGTGNCSIIRTDSNFVTELS